MPHANATNPALKHARLPVCGLGSIVIALLAGFGGYCVGCGISAIVLRGLRTWTNLKRCPFEARELGEGFIGITRVLLVLNQHRRLDWFWYDMMVVKHNNTKTLQMTLGWFMKNCIFYETVDPVLVRHILRDNHNNYIKSDPDVLPRSIPFHGVSDLLGKGIFGIDHGPAAEDGGRGWHLQRKIAASIFTKQKFQTYMRDVFIRKGRELCTQLDGIAAQGDEVTHAIYSTLYPDACATLQARPCQSLQMILRDVTLGYWSLATVHRVPG